MRVALLAAPYLVPESQEIGVALRTAITDLILIASQIFVLLDCGP